MKSEIKMDSRNHSLHSALMSNQIKVWKTKTGPLQGDKAWSGDPKSALSAKSYIIRNTLTNIETCLVVEL